MNPLRYSRKISCCGPIHMLIGKAVLERGEKRKRSEWETEVRKRRYYLYIIEYPLTKFN